MFEHHKKNYWIDFDQLFLILLVMYLVLTKKFHDTYVNFHKININVLRNLEFYKLKYLHISYINSQLYTRYNSTFESD